MNAKNLVSALTLFSLLVYSLPVAAMDLEGAFTGPGAGQSEYFNSNRDKRMLIQVNILSGVTKPGIHQVPDNSQILDALALAGGLTPDADFEKVFIKRRVPGAKGKTETIEVNIDDIMRDNHAAIPGLQNYDTILVEQRPRTEQKFLTTLAVISSVVTIASGILIINKLK